MSGTGRPTGNVHTVSTAPYDGTVTKIERDIVMSTEKTTPRTGLIGPAKGKVEPAAERKPLSVRNVDVEELQIDETFDAACDPYNSTGQFLADAIKRKYDDQ